MPKEPFMLVSLEDNKAKKLAQVLSNETATKILSALTKGKATESELAKQLSSPISTIHYNLKQLVEAKLVITEEFHYSSKGREVLHYQLANKYIIIAPQEEQESFLQKLKGLLPATTIALGVGAALYIFSQTNNSQVILPYAEPIAESFAQDSVMKMAAEPMMANAEVAIEQTSRWWLSSEFALGVLAGIVLLILLIVVIKVIRKK